MEQPTRPPASPTYRLGDNQLAGDRLALLAEVFGPTTEAFLTTARRELSGTPALAVDLGCGPGHTTDLVHRVFAAAETVGLEASATFVERARSGYPALRFEHHDVRELPFPVPPADVLFARYLLAHLPRAGELVERWGNQLAPRGVLLLEEVERIDTDVGAFREYLDISGGMLTHYGVDLYVGNVLRDLGDVPGLRCVESRTATIEPSTGEVTALFAQNLATWRNDPYVRNHIDAQRVDALDAGLDASAGSPTRGDIVWTHRQLVYERL